MIMTGIGMDSTVVAIKDQMSCDLAGEVVILSMKNGVYYTLNPLGSRIWTLIQEPVKVGKVLEIIIEEYDIGKEKCGEDLLALLHELEKEGLIIIEDASVP
jgi:hypothetical protein